MKKKRWGIYTPKKKLKKKDLHQGILSISNKIQNTFVTLADDVGNVVCSYSAGNLSYSGAKKRTPYVTQQLIKFIIAKAVLLGVKKVRLFLKGDCTDFSLCVQSILEECKDMLVIVCIIKDFDYPYNGCRPLKDRRI